MPPKSFWWDHFWSKNGVHYKGDKTHLAAWCLKCLEYEKELLRSADSVALAVGTISSYQTEEQIHDTGKSKTKSICYLQIARHKLTPMV